jgi:hypothetical protein
MLFGISVRISVFISASSMFQSQRIRPCHIAS